jgi:hypothetical protein
MIVLDATGPTPDFVMARNGISVVFRAINPLSQEVCDSVVVELSVHNALFLSEKLRRFSVAAIDRSQDKRTCGPIISVR